MTNIALLILTFGSLLIVAMSQFASIRASHSDRQQLQSKLDAIHDRLVETARARTNLQETVALRRGALQAAQAELSEPRNPSQESPMPSLDPSVEGGWPAERPYFYLSKQHLKHLRFQPLDESNRLTDEAALVLGMNSEERAAVTEVQSEFIGGVHALHLADAQRVEPLPIALESHRREIAFRIPARTNEVQALRLDLERAWRSILGDQRAELLIQKASDRLARAYGDFEGRGYDATYSARRDADGKVHHELELRRDDGKSSNSREIHFPVEPGSTLWKYRHLFGDQPLIPVQTGPSAGQK